MTERSLSSHRQPTESSERAPRFGISRTTGPRRFFVGWGRDFRAPGHCLVSARDRSAARLARSPRALQQTFAAEATHPSG